MFFTPKYQSYTKTKPVRVPEELINDILSYAHKLDEYKAAIKDKDEAQSLEKLTDRVTRFLTSEIKKYSTKIDLIELKP